MIQSAQRARAATFAPLVALMAVVAFLLVGCSSDKETQTTFTMSQNGIEITMVYYATGDLVTKQTSENVIDYAKVGIADKAQAEEEFGPYMAEYDGVAGIEHSVEYGDTSATETITVDYEVADLAEVSRLTGAEFSADVDKGAGVSLEQSRKMLKEAGYTEVE